MKNAAKSNASITEQSPVLSWSVQGQDGTTATFFVKITEHENGAEGLPRTSMDLTVGVYPIGRAMSHHWNNIGSGDWRSFLIGLEKNYVMEKLMGARWRVPDIAASISSARANILEWRKAGSVTANEARAAYDDILDAERSIGAEPSGCSAGYLVNCFSTIPMFRDQYWEMLAHKNNPDGEIFFTTLWTTWIAEIERSLNAPESAAKTQGV